MTDVRDGTFLGRRDGKTAKRVPYWDEERRCWLVPLTRGKFAIVDESDVERVAEYSWCAIPHRRTWYADARIRGKGVRMHRFILGEFAPAIVDHINGDGLDNRRNNMRSATPAQSQANRRHTKRGIGSFRGVTPSPTAGKWVAQISIDDKNVYLGTFSTVTEAAVAYDCAAIAARGDYAIVNFPLEVR